MLYRPLILFQLALHLSIHVRAQPCFTLAGTICSQWSAFAIPDTNATLRFPYSPVPLGFSTALSIYIDNQTAITNWFKSYWGCSGYSGTGLRYRTSMLCAEIVSDQSNLKSCNTNNTTGTPPPLCRSTCMSYVASLSEILQNQTICPGLRQERWLALNDTCESAPFNGTDGMCVSGNANEPGTCGYTKQDICTLCANAASRDTCISGAPNATNIVPFTSPAIPSQPSTSKTLIIALTVSLGGFFLLILIGLLWRMNATCRRHVHHVRHLFSRPWTRRYGRPHHISTSATEYTYTSTPSSARDYIVIHPYFERRPDELCLHQGGLVSIRRVYDDNWAYGVCSTSGQRGMFPLVCVSPVRAITNNTEKPASLMLGERRASVGVVIPRRTTSRATILRSSVDSTDSTVSSHHPHPSSLSPPSPAYMQDSHCGSTTALSSDGSAPSPADSYHSDETLIGIGHAVEERNIVGPMI